MDQPGKVANPACGQLNGESEQSSSLFPFALENLGCETGLAVPSRVSLLI